MKRYNFLLITVLAFALTGCNSELEESADLNVNVTTSENVSITGDTIIVKKGNPVLFNFVGDPDNITFFSGEKGCQYIYRDRVTVDPSEVVSSKLMFSVWYQYGNAKSAANLVKMYISDAFTGLVKNNFKEDSVLVEGFQWSDLVDQSKLPQTPGSAKTAQSFEVDLGNYLGKRLAMAICYKAQDNSAAQPKVNFVDMKIVNEMKDGTTSTLYAGNFGFTPVNMMCHHSFEDQRGLANNREYGTVTNNVAGIWNLTSAGSGNFFIHSSSSGKPLKYSWLISDLITANACSPDAGMSIKNITQRLDNYSYTYNNVGKYKATFVVTNSNYKAESRILRELNIKVIE